MIPAIQCMMAKWVPQQERPMFSVVYFGTFLGIVPALSVTGVMCETPLGWPLSFYFFGALGLLWCLPWFLLVFDSPADHPRLRAGERAFIEQSVGEAPDKKRLSVPWRRLLLCRGLWACCLQQTGVGWVYNLVLTSLPLYLANILHFDLHSNGVLSSVPYIAGAVASPLCGWAVHAVLRSGCLSRINTYRAGNAASLVVPSLLLVGIALAGCDAPAIVVMLALSSVFMTANYSSSYGNIMVLAPNYSGTLLGLANTLSNGTGIIVPYVVAAFTKGNQTRSAWNAVFYLSAAVGILAYGIYLIFSTDKEQSWNDPKNVKDDKTEGSTTARVEGNLEGGEAADCGQR